MILPSTNRVETQKNNYFKFWIYGEPFTGKTTFCDSAPTPLNLNTDGNVKTVTMARLPIHNQYEGRIKKLGWEIFKEAISDLEKGSDFETIVLDLTEDIYEMCRLFMYDKLGITHESDDSFRAWDKVRTEFLSTMRNFMNLPYNIILISHEDKTKDFTSRSGEKYTSIKPNVNDKVALKLAGMVDFVGRVVVNDDGSRILSFKTNEVIFGGGRLNFGVTEIPLEWGELMKLYEDLSVDKPEKNRSEAKTEVPQNVKNEEKPAEEPEDDGPGPEVNSVTGEVVEDAPRRRRRTRKTEEPAPAEPAEEESPKRTRRRRAVEE